MATCNGCGENVDELQKVKVDGRVKKLCEDCVDAARAEATVAEESEAAVQQMMGYKGRR
jgi:ribosome-binding protein aMBF1 (putative translation factor)